MPFSFFCNSAACAIPRARDIAIPEYHSIGLRKTSKQQRGRAQDRPVELYRITGYGTETPTVDWPCSKWRVRPLRPYRRPLVQSSDRILETLATSQSAPNGKHEGESRAGQVVFL